MKKVKLVQAIFTQEEIAAINTKNIKLEEENEMLKKELGILDCKGGTPELVGHAEFVRCLIEENKKLKEENKKLKIIIENNELEQKADWKHIEELEEENSTLKANVEFLHSGLDDREGSLELMKEENERLENEINNSKSIGNIIANCVILSFFCFLFSGVLCIWFMMIADAIMGFKFVVFL